MLGGASSLAGEGAGLAADHVGIKVVGAGCNRPQRKQASDVVLGRTRINVIIFLEYD
jgi:hypothetical protein